MKSTLTNTHDAVDNRTAYTLTTPLDGTAVTTYTYDAANRLQVAVSPGHSVTYTWDVRGNLRSDGTFTYTYSAAGRMVRAASITTTLVYTYTADGLRIAQADLAYAGAQTYVWDWATGVPEMLYDGRYTYLIGHDTLGWEGARSPMSPVMWTFVLPDALGSVRQETDANGDATAVREWSLYGEELGGAQAGLGYTGEWFDTGVGLTYLRARWYDGTVGRFTQRDAVMQTAMYRYASNNPVNRLDPSGYLDWAACIIHGEMGTCMVQPGDSIYLIAREIRPEAMDTELTPLVADILALNPFVQSHPSFYLYPGDQLTLRADWITALLPPSPTPNPTPSPPLPPIYLPPPSLQWYVTEPVADSGATGDPDAFVDDLRGALSQAAQPINLVVNMIVGAGEYWNGSPLVSYRFGLGLDFFTQLIADVPLDLCTTQRLGRAAVSAGEGYVVSLAAQALSVKASTKAFALTLPLGAEAPWLPPVATGVTYFAIYIPTNVALSAGFNYLNEEYLFVALNLNPE